MDSDSIIEEWTKRGIKIPPSKQEKVFDEVLLVSDLYWKSPAPKSCCESYLERCLRNLWRYPSSKWDEGTVPTPERNDRTFIRNS